MVAMATAASPAGRFMSRTNTASSPEMNVGTPNTSQVFTASVWSFCNRSSGHAVVDRREHAGPVDADVVERLRHDVAVAEIEPVLVADGEDRGVGGEELVGLTVAHHQAGEHGEERGIALGLLPHRLPALLDMGLLEGEGEEPDVPVGTPTQSGHEVLVGVAGERAAVVPGDGERLGHGSEGNGHRGVRRTRARRFRS